MLTTTLNADGKLKLWLIVLIIVLAAAGVLFGGRSQQKILVYYSQGIHKGSFEDMTKFFERNYGKQYKIEKIDDNGIVNMNWEKDTVLLAMPGGNQFDGWKEQFLLQVLQNPKFREKIQRYVEGGGSYLGICGGAMIAASDFGINSKIGNIDSVVAKGVKLLALHQGKAVGPIPPMQLAEAGQADSNAGVSAIAVDYKDKTAYLVYMGGPELPEMSNNAEVVGTTTFAGKVYNVMVKVNYGKGKAFITPVHIESDPEDWRADAKIYGSLLLTESVRKEIVRDVVTDWLLKR